MPFGIPQVRRSYTPFSEIVKCAGADKEKTRAAWKYVIDWGDSISPAVSQWHRQSPLGPPALPFTNSNIDRDRISRTKGACQSQSTMEPAKNRRQVKKDGRWLNDPEV